MIGWLFGLPWLVLMGVFSVLATLFGFAVDHWARFDGAVVVGYGTGHALRRQPPGGRWPR